MTEKYQPYHTRNPIPHVDTPIRNDVVDDDPNIEQEDNGNFTESHALLSFFFFDCELEYTASIRGKLRIVFDSTTRKAQLVWPL